MNLNDSIGNLMKMSREMICIISLEGRFLNINKSFCQVLGYTSKELLDKPFLDFVHIAEKEKHLHFFKNFKSKTSDYFELEYRFLQKNGKPIWLSFSFTMIENDQVFALARNVSKLKDENKVLLNKLNESVEYTNSLIQNVPQLIWSADSNGNIDFYNQYCLEYIGMNNKKKENWTLFSFLHPDDVERTVKAWNNCISTGEPYEIEHRLKKFSCGEYRWVQTQAYAQTDKKKNIIKWFGNSTDVHDLRLLHKETKESNLFLQKLLSISTLFIWETDIKGIIKSSKGSIPQHFKLDPILMSEKYALSIFKEFPELQKGIKRALNGEEYVCQIVIDELKFDVCCSSIQGEHGEETGMIGIIHPGIKTEFDQGNVLQIIDTVNNELRAPLHTIISFSEILEKRVKDEECKKYLKYIISSGDKMKSFLMNIYDLDVNSSTVARDILN